MATDGELDPVDTEERTWVRAWREGDSVAGTRLYDRYCVRITKFFQSKVYLSEDVNDLVQTTFIKLRESRTEIRVSARAYIFGVARFALRHHVRKQTREQAKVGRYATAVREVGDIPLNAVEPDPEILTGQKMESRLLYKSLRRLPMDDQVILEMFYIRELKRSEVAEIIGTSELALASRLRRARARLAKIMLEQERDFALLESTSKSVATWLKELSDYLVEMKQCSNPD